MSGPGKGHYRPYSPAGATHAWSLLGVDLWLHLALENQ